MLKIRTQEEIDNHESIALYDNYANLIGVITSEASLIDIRVQIKELGIEGYYFIYNKQVMYIDTDGRINSGNSIRPFQNSMNLLIELL